MCVYVGVGVCVRVCVCVLCVCVRVRVCVDKSLVPYTLIHHLIKQECVQCLLVVLSHCEKNDEVLKIVHVYAFVFSFLCVHVCTCVCLYEMWHSSYNRAVLFPCLLSLNSNTSVPVYICKHL